MGTRLLRQVKIQSKQIGAGIELPSFKLSHGFNSFAIIFGICTQQRKNMPSGKICEQLKLDSFEIYEKHKMWTDFLTSLGATLCFLMDQEWGCTAGQTEQPGRQPPCSATDCLSLSLCETAQGVGLL